MRPISQKDKRYIRELFILLQQPLISDHCWLYYMGQLDYILYHKYALQGLVVVRLFLRNNFPDVLFHQIYTPLKTKWRQLVKEEEAEEENSQCSRQSR